MISGDRNRGRSSASRWTVSGANGAASLQGRQLSHLLNDPLNWRLTHRTHFNAYLALAAVCLFWGTTYLGIRMSLESFPPLLLVTVRYLISGSILLLFAKARGLYLPRGRELAAACFSGFLTLGIGNGALVFSEVLIPSGIAGL